MMSHQHLRWIKVTLVADELSNFKFQIANHCNCIDLFIMCIIVFCHKHNYSYVMGGVHSKVINAVTTQFSKQDKLLSQKVDELQGVTGEQLGLKEEFCCPVPAAVSWNDLSMRCEHSKVINAVTAQFTRQDKLLSQKVEKLQEVIDYA